MGGSLMYTPPKNHPVMIGTIGGSGAPINSQRWQGQGGVVIDEIKGWIDSPDIRDAREPRSGTNGEYADTPFYGGRSIKISGVVDGPTVEEFEANRLALAELLQLTTSEVVLKIPKADTVAPAWAWADELEGFERAYVRVQIGVVFSDTLSPISCEWTVALRASDPLIYDDVEVVEESGTSGTATRTVSISNPGRYASAPRITADGPLGSVFAVRESASALRLPVSGLDVQASESIEFDVSAKTVRYTSTYAGARLRGINGLLALWMLDENSGTTADNLEGTATYDGTYTGGFTLNQTGPIAGLDAVALNGSTGYVEVAYNAGIFPDMSISGFMTWEGWVNFDTLSGSRCIVDSITSNRGWRLEWDGSGFVYTAGDGTTTTSAPSVPLTLATGTWYHLMVEPITIHGFFSGGYRLYLNGVLVASETGSPTAVTATSGGYRFGARRSGANYFDGLISAFAVYDQNYGAELSTMLAGTATSNARSKLVTSNTVWAPTPTGASEYTLASASLNTGSKLEVAYRPARV